MPGIRRIHRVQDDERCGQHLRFRETGIAQFQIQPGAEHDVEDDDGEDDERGDLNKRCFADNALHLTCKQQSDRQKRGPRCREVAAQSQGLFRTLRGTENEACHDSSEYALRRTVRAHGHVIRDGGSAWTNSGRRLRKVGVRDVHGMAGWITCNGVGQISSDCGVMERLAFPRASIGRFAGGSAVDD